MIITEGVIVHSVLKLRTKTISFGYLKLLIPYLFTTPAMAEMWGKKGNSYEVRTFS